MQYTTAPKEIFLKRQTQFSNMHKEEKFPRQLVASLEDNEWNLS